MSDPPENVPLLVSGDESHNVRGEATSVSTHIFPESRLEGDKSIMQTIQDSFIKMCEVDLLEAE